MSYIAIQTTEEGGEEVLGASLSLELLRTQVIEDVTALYIEQVTTEKHREAICTLMEEGIDNRVALHAVLGPEFPLRLMRFVNDVLASVKFEPA